MPRFTTPAMRLTVLLLLTIASTGCGVVETAFPNRWTTLNKQTPLIIAHRGDSGNYPEHTLAAYDSALHHKAEYIELDIVLTKDNMPICRHDLYLSTTTDIASSPLKFGQGQDLAANYTLSELKQLKAIQSVKSRPQAKSLLRIPTLSDAVELVNRFNDERDEDDEVLSGLYIEIKQPEVLRASGRDASKAVLDMLAQFKQAGTTPPIILQCFDRAEAERLASMTDYPVVWLSKEPVDLNKLPRGIAGLGLSKSAVGLQEIEDEYTSALVDRAHAKGLFVHVWTFRDDQLQGTGFDDAEKEIQAYLQAGVDGIFTDYPETARDARRSIKESWNKASATARTRKSAKGRTE